MDERMKRKIKGILQTSGLNKVIQSFSRIFKDDVINLIKEDVRKSFFLTLTECTSLKPEIIKDLLKRINIVQKNVLCAHDEFELYVMQAMILALSVRGPIIEFGCYKGGTTAKLSLICKLTGRKLYAFDSFEGLPLPNKQDLKHDYMPMILTKKIVQYSKGGFAGSLEEVKNNVKIYGNIEVCEFIKGYFEDTLPDFKIKPACIFMDVDFIESAQTIIKHMWPKLLPGGLLFSHEGLVVDYIKAITNISWWEKNLNQKPPLLYGAGYGCCWRSNNIAFASNIVYFKKEM